MLIENMTNHDLRLAMLPYSSALKVVNMYVDTIQEELFAKRHSNPIEHVKMRLKRPSSIARKLEKTGLEPTVDNAITYIEDIAGVRIVCLFQNDIYRISNFIETLNNIKILNIKDYIRHPKPNGYRSYHMHVEVPVRMLDKEQWVKVEIQLRTVAMDFWASLEHKIRYKKKDAVAGHISEELLNCATMIEKIDLKMQQLNIAIDRLSSDSDDTLLPDSLTEYLGD